MVSILPAPGIYYSAYINGQEAEKGKVIKWFRGEYTNKTEARAELRSI